MTGFGGGGIVKRRSATTGATFALGIVDVTEIVVDDPEVEVCNLDGNGLPGAFLAELLESEGLTIFGERVELFLATVFLAGAFLAGAFLAGAFLATAFLEVLFVGFFDATFFDAIFFD
jgi:hypothetical protein